MKKFLVILAIGFSTSAFAHSVLPDINSSCSKATRIMIACLMKQCEQYVRPLHVCLQTCKDNKACMDKCREAYNQSKAAKLGMQCAQEKTICPDEKMAVSKSCHPQATMANKKGQ